MAKAASTIAIGLCVTSLVAAWWLWFGPASDAYIPSSSLTESERLRRSCGPISLAIAAQLRGYNIRPTDLMNECHYRADGVDNRELCRLASKYQLQLLDKVMTWNELIAADMPVLLHYSRGHFVVANPVERSAQLSGMVRIYDPDKSARYLGQLELESMWDGHALLVDCHRASHNDPHDTLATDSWWIDVGAQSKSKEDAAYPVRLTNRTLSPLELRIAHTTCNCTSASLEKSVLGPGESTILRAQIALAKKRGPYYERVTVHSSATDHEKDWIVTLAGSAIDEPSLSETTLQLGEAFPGDDLAGSIVVRDRGDKSLKVVSATIETSTSLGAESFVCTKMKIGEKIEDRQVIRRHSSIVPGDWLIQVSARIPKQPVYGTINASLVVTVESGVETNILNCPVVGRIVPDITVTPTTLILRPKTPSRDVNVSRRNEARIEVASASVEGLQNVTCEILQEEKTPFTVVRLTADFQPGSPSASGRLRIAMADGGECLVPLIVLP